MTNPASLFQSVAGINLGNASHLLEDSNDDSIKHMNGLAESFEAFIQGRYKDASEVRFYLPQKFV